MQHWVKQPVKKKELGGRPTVHLAMQMNSETNNQPVIFNGDTLVYQ